MFYILDSVPNISFIPFALLYHFVYWCFSGFCIVLLKQTSSGRVEATWIELVIIEARDLIAADLRGTSDPYVRVHYGSKKKRTKVWWWTFLYLVIYYAFIRKCSMHCFSEMRNVNLLAFWSNRNEQICWHSTALGIFRWCAYDQFRLVQIFQPVAVRAWFRIT